VTILSINFDNGFSSKVDLDLVVRPSEKYFVYSFAKFKDSGKMSRLDE